jgi:hypothetical protein
MRSIPALRVLVDRIRGYDTYIVQPLRFRLVPRQLRGLLTRTVTVTVAAVLLLTLWVSHLHDKGWTELAPLALAAGVGALLCAYSYGAYATAFTECTQSGIRTRGLAGVRTCPWAEVRDITPLRDGVVRISTTSGMNFWLGAPVQSRLMPDPEFFSKVTQVMDCWLSATERPAGTIR